MKKIVGIGVIIIIAVFVFWYGKIEKYTVDKTYTYQLAPGKIITGTKFTIPEVLAKGTNLSSDTYISKESLLDTKECTASIFLDGSHEAVKLKENNVTYSVASTTGAGAGNRYEETVYAILGTSPCKAVRYFVHYGVIQNYDPGTVKEFDKEALLKEFDDIRHTLVLNPSY